MYQYIPEKMFTWVFIKFDVSAKKWPRSTTVQWYFFQIAVIKISLSQVKKPVSHNYQMPGTIREYNIPQLLDKCHKNVMVHSLKDVPAQSFVCTPCSHTVTLTYLMSYLWQLSHQTSQQQSTLESKTFEYSIGLQCQDRHIGSLYVWSRQHNTDP